MTRSADAYGDDLAFIHDAGFGQIAEHAAQVAINELKRRPLASKRLVDLGCGSGVLAGKVIDAGFEVVGFDQSSAMIDQCRARVPKGSFQHSSFLDAELPSAAAVTAVGEVFCYLFDQRNGWGALKKLLRAISKALVPGGILIFDVVTAGRAPAPGGKSGFRNEKDWACLYSQVEEPRLGTLFRKITTFRREGENFRRREETHRLLLFEPKKILTALRDLGFRVRLLRGYGEFLFPPGLVGFIARKR